MDLQLKGKTAIVLAASKGLGKACAIALAEGANVVIGARDGDPGSGGHGNTFDRAGEGTGRAD